MNCNGWGWVKTLVLVRQRGADGGTYGEGDDEPMDYQDKNRGKERENLKHVHLAISLTRTHTTAHIVLSLASPHTTVHVALSLARTQQPILLSHSPAHTPQYI
jgi:hypothetical protein